jgi:hypothetical protein
MEDGNHINSNKFICSCLDLCFVCAYVLFSCFCVLYLFLFFCVLMQPFVEISNIVLFYFIFMFHCFWCLHNKIIHKIIKPKSITLGFT